MLKRYISAWVDSGDFTYENLWIYIGSFIDRFKEQPSLYKVLEEPVFPEDIECFMSSLVAGVAEQLCIVNKIIPPDWVDKKCYYLKDPYFKFKDGGLKWITLVESPIAFRKRNLFVFESIIDRC